MQSEQSTNTWFSVSARPPALPAGERLACFFKFASGRPPQLGFFHADGDIRILSESRRNCCQADLDLETATHWQPLSETLLEELEGA